jgi:predicted DNA-binding transcriptional regulator YafY
LGYETSIKVAPNMELFKLLLSFGPRIKIVSPNELVTRFESTIKEYNNLYKN